MILASCVLAEQRIFHFILSGFLMLARIMQGARSMPWCSAAQLGGLARSLHGLCHLGTILAITLRV